MRHDYLRLMDQYPEQHNHIVQNVIEAHGINRQGVEVDCNMLLFTRMSNVSLWRDGLTRSIKDTLWMNDTACLSRMMDATLIGDWEEIMRVCHTGYDLNATNYDGQTVLHIMAKHGHHLAIEHLLTEGADVNITDRWGRTALQEAIAAKQEHTVSVLDAWNSKMFVDNAAADLCEAASQVCCNLLHAATLALHTFRHHSSITNWRVSPVRPMELAT
jgi:hypothetical protein